MLQNNNKSHQKIKLKKWQSPHNVSINKWSGFKTESAMQMHISNTGTPDTYTCGTWSSNTWTWTPDSFASVLLAEGTLKKMVQAGPRI